MKGGNNNAALQHKLKYIYIDTKIQSKTAQIYWLRNAESRTWLQRNRAASGEHERFVLTDVDQKRFRFILFPVGSTLQEASRLWLRWRQDALKRYVSAAWSCLSLVFLQTWLVRKCSCRRHPPRRSPDLRPGPGPAPPSPALCFGWFSWRLCWVWMVRPAANHFPSFWFSLHPASDWLSA